MAENNVLSYPQMTRQREESIQANEIAYAEDVNAELDYIMDTFNQLIMMLTGEWGDGTGRIYELVDEAVSIANQALAAANDCVKKSGDTMTGQLNIALVPVSDYNVVNKKYVDDTIAQELSEPLNRIEQLENFRDNLNATQVKLDNSNFTGKNVNDGMNELFISVSNGKSIVAAAITGKGVQTASDASFKTMADNINAILTFNEGTSGGTATAQDILYGKTAYARGSLIIGNYIPLDTSDATASSDTIAEGYTAYVNNKKIVGKMRAYPIYGTDTSDATATVDDIAYGKVAYARGQRLVGTSNGFNVEEIYGISQDDFTISPVSQCINPPNEEEDVGKIINYNFSKEGNYCVRLITGKDTGEQYVESFAVNDDGLYYNASAGATTSDINYKKFRYTKEELGLVGEGNSVDGTEIVDVFLGCPGFGGDNNKCIAAILYKNSGKDFLRLLTYHLSDNGYIGTLAAFESNTIDVNVDITDSIGSYIKGIGDLSDPMTLYMINYGAASTSSFSPKLGKVKIYQVVTPTETKYSITINRDNTGGSGPKSYYINLKITKDGRFLKLYRGYDNSLYRVWDIRGDTPEYKGVPGSATIRGTALDFEYINQKYYLFAEYNESEYWKVGLSIYEVTETEDSFSSSLISHARLSEARYIIYFIFSSMSISYNI